MKKCFRRKALLKLTMVGLLIAILVAATACGDSGKSEDPNKGSENNASQTQNEGKKLVFKFIPMATASAYWTALRNGAEDAAKEFGSQYGEIEIQFDGPKEDTDVNEQVDYINNAVSAGVDGIMIAVSSPTVPHDAIVAAISAGVPVVVVDQYLDPMDANAFIGTNGVEMCKSLADYMSKSVLKNTGSYASMVYNMTSLASVDRYNGFQEGMKESSPAMKSLEYEITNSDIAETQTKVVNILQANKDLKVIFANNDRSALGTLNGIKQAGRNDIAICNVDINLELLAAMKEGIVKASALQMPNNQGYEAVKTLLTLHDGGQVTTKETDSGSFLLTPENMDSEEAINAIRQYIPDYTPAK